MVDFMFWITLPNLLEFSKNTVNPP